MNNFEFIFLKITLYKLINITFKIRQSTRKVPFFQLFLHKKKYFFKKEIALVTFNGLRKFLNDYLFEDFQPEFLKNDDPDWKRTLKFMVIYCPVHSNKLFL
jgi:hypothetical protein